MNKIVDAVKKHAFDNPDVIAYTVFDEAASTEFSTDSLKWGELNVFSDRLAGYIKSSTKADTPIVVYGHKSKYMLVCFMACVKSGHAYVPVDVSVPASRVQDIIDTVDPEMILSTADGEFTTSGELVSLEQIETLTIDSKYSIDEDSCLKPEDVFYIIFTSGSTGKPKGVQITTECLTNYCEWGQNLGGMNINENQKWGGPSVMVERITAS